MKLKELLEQYGEYTVPQELIEKLEKPKQKTIWDLEKGNEYFYCCGNKVYQAYWCNNEYYDQLRIIVGNIFLTKEEAEKEVERREVEALLLKNGGRRLFDGYNHNYHIGLDDYEKHLKVYILMTPTQGTIYFDTKAQAEKAISEIGEERIKKVLFEVK